MTTKVSGAESVKPVFAFGRVCCYTKMNKERTLAVNVKLNFAFKLPLRITFKEESSYLEIQATKKQYHTIDIFQ